MPGVTNFRSIHTHGFVRVGAGTPAASAGDVAANAAGIPYCDDPNGPEQGGISRMESTAWQGRRVSSAAAYLHPARGRPNLTVETGALVRRVVVRGGRAIAELALGLIEPTGRLPVSFAEHVGQLPVYYNQISGQHGNRYADLTQRAPFAFGEGLSYTSVEYADLQVANTVVGPGDVVRAQVTVHNTGARPTRETVQVYVHDTVTSVTWAEKELKAYRQVDLAPGQSRTVDLELPVDSCSLVDAQGRRVVEPGRFELLVGPSSRDEVLLRATFDVRA